MDLLTDLDVNGLHSRPRCQLIVPAAVMAVFNASTGPTCLILRVWRQKSRRHMVARYCYATTRPRRMTIFAYARGGANAHAPRLVLSLSPGYWNWRQHCFFSAEGDNDDPPGASIARLPNVTTPAATNNRSARSRLSAWRHHRPAAFPVSFL